MKQHIESGMKTIGHVTVSTNKIDPHIRSAFSIMPDAVISHTQRRLMCHNYALTHLLVNGLKGAALHLLEMVIMNIPVFFRIHSEHYSSSLKQFSEPFGASGVLISPTTLQQQIFFALVYERTRKICCESLTTQNDRTSYTRAPCNQSNPTLYLRRFQNDVCRLPGFRRDAGHFCMFSQNRQRILIFRTRQRILNTMKLSKKIRH